MSLRKKALCFILVAITFIAMLASVFLTESSEQYDLSVGSVCPEDIYATRNIVDSVTTNARKDAAAAAVEDVYVVDSGITNTAVARTKNILSDIYSYREIENEAITDENSVAPTLPENHTGLSDEIFYMALGLSDSNFTSLSSITPQIVETVMTHGVESVDKGLDAFNTELAGYHTNSSVEAIAYTIATKTIVVNKTIDTVETDKRRQLASDSVENVSYMKNQIIARRGEIITEAQYTMLTDLGFIKGEAAIDLFRMVGVSLLLLTVTALAVLYYILIGASRISLKPLSLTIICTLLTLLGTMLIFLSVYYNSSVLIYLMPLCLVPALCTLLLTPDMAVILNIIISVLAGIQTKDTSIALSLILSGTAAAYFFSKVRRRGNLLPATIITAFTYALFYSSIYMDTARSASDVLKIFALALFGGFFGGVLSIGTIPFWEAIFDVITPMKLGELSNPEHELLKKMLIKAPGTYHHSLTVANMAESAAAEIGANSLLARVGAYYHDIGKTEHPLYFKENQFGDNNPHDFLPPEDSARILLNHVTDGAALADQHRLPSAVKDIILQHHGTTTTAYFLFKAREIDKNADASLFTYPGPSPLTKEATIIMLADACEAAVRAMRESGNGDVREIVDSIVNTRINEGQLRSSSLTFRDLDKVKDSFVRTLEQYFHKRIIYPQNKEQNNG